MWGFKKKKQQHKNVQLINYNLNDMKKKCNDKFDVDEINFQKKIDFQHENKEEK